MSMPGSGKPYQMSCSLNNAEDTKLHKSNVRLVQESHDTAKGKKQKTRQASRSADSLRVRTKQRNKKKKTFNFQ